MSTARKARPAAKQGAAVDAVGAHNQRMWDRLADAGIPYTRPQGTPPKDPRGKRRFLDELTMAGSAG